MENKWYIYRDDKDSRLHYMLIHYNFPVTEYSWQSNLESLVGCKELKKHRYDTKEAWRSSDISRNKEFTKVAEADTREEVLRLAQMNELLD